MPEHCTVLAAVHDLIFETRIRAAASQAGLAVQTVRTPSEVREAAANQPVVLTLVDLNTVTDPAEVVRAAVEGTPDAPVVAFVSHVDAELAQAARAAGATRVLARSRFVSELPAILSGCVE